MKHSAVPGQAIWHNADLTEANLRLANLSRADLSGANRIDAPDPGAREALSEGSG